MFSEFSQRWLIPKLVLIGIITIVVSTLFIDIGIPSIIWNESWIEFVARMLGLVLLEKWMGRNLINYAGSESMVTFGISKETFAAAETVIKVLSLVLEGIACVLMLIKVAGNVFFSSYGICWESFLEPIAEYRTLALITIVLSVLQEISMAYRTVSKDEISDD